MSYIRVYDYFYTPGGSPRVNIVGWAKILQLPNTTSGYITNGTDAGTKSYSDSNGLLEWYLPSGALVDFTIPLAGIINQQGTIPGYETRISGVL